MQLIVAEGINKTLSSVKIDDNEFTLASSVNQILVSIQEIFKNNHDGIYTCYLFTKIRYRFNIFLLTHQPFNELFSPTTYYTEISNRFPHKNDELSIINSLRNKRIKN